IASIATPDAATVAITLKQPASNFLYGLAWGDAVIFGPESVANNKTNPIGTGPYRFQRWNRGDRVELVRNDAYWNKVPAISRATFRFIPDAQAQVSALRAGDVDALSNLAAQEAAEQLKADQKLKVVVGNTEGETIVAINNGKAPFNDIRVRRALAHAIDR